MNQPPRRGRPSREQSAAIDRKILEAGLAIFLDVGFTDATMEAIAERAGVARANVYTRHADKLTLLKAVIDYRLSLWSKLSAQMDWMLGDTLELRLRHYARNVIAWSCKEEVRAFERLVQGATSLPAPHSELQRALKQPMLDILTKEFRKSERLRNEPAVAPARLAAIFFAMLSAYDRDDHRAVNHEDDMFNFADQVVELFLHGIQ